MFKNLNVKKIKNNNDYLINKFNTYNEFSNNIEDDFSKIRISKKTIDFDENINNIENDKEEFGSITNDILNDSLENENDNNENKNLTLDSNIDIDALYTSIISNKRKSIAERNNSINRKLTIGSNKTNPNKISNLNSIVSTQQQTNNKKFFNENKEINSSKFISEFKCEPLIITNDKDDIVQKINKNITFFKNWLSSINLPFYYENFINNDIYEITQLIKISKIKTRQEIFSYINSIIKTNKIGHIYRILIKIDIDTGFIDENLSNFLTPKRFLKNQSKSNYSNYSDNELLISGIKNVFCTNKIEERSCIKLFFEKYNLKSLCSNFMNNGFDILEFIILQMFSRFPINDYILEKNMYISDYNDRKKILMILNNEVNKINKMMSSEEYLSYTLNRRIKYEDFFLSNGRDSNFIFNNDDRCDFCQIF